MSDGEEGAIELQPGLREQRRAQILNGAMLMLTRDGLANVTVQRLADELGCSVGLLYRYFASKDALLAELQRAALDALDASLALSQEAVDAVVAERGLELKAATLTRVVAAATFWVDAETVFPDQIELSRRLYTDPVLMIDESVAGRALAAAVRLLDRGRQLLDAASVAGSLDAGPSLERAVILIAGTTGVLLTNGLRRWGPTLFDGQHLAGVMVHDLIRGWGADSAALTAAEALVGELVATGRLIPPVETITHP